MTTSTVGRVLRGALAITLLALMAQLGVAQGASAAGVEGATISGTVSLPVGAGPALVLVTVTFADGANAGGTRASAIDGSYAIAGLAPGAYRIAFQYEGVENVLGQWWPKQYTDVDAAAVTLAAGQTFTADATLEWGGLISGALTGAGAPLPYGTIDISTSPWIGFTHAHTSFDAVSSTYSITRVVPGSYRLVFGGNRGWKTQYWKDKSSQVGSVPVIVSAGQALTGMDVDLHHAPTISGSISVVQGASAVSSSNYVDAIQNGRSMELEMADANGHYTLNNLAPGAYTVCAEPKPDTLQLETCVGGDAQNWNSTPNVNVADEQVVSNVDMTIRVGGKVTGSLATRSSPVEALHAVDANGRVRLYRSDPVSGYFAATKYDAYVNADGTFSTYALEPGQYVVKFFDTGGTLESQYWQNSQFFAQSTVIDLASGDSRDLGQVVLEPRYLPTTTRLAGVDRYATSARVASEQFPADGSSVPVVYVASGENFPDALAAVPLAAAQGGALLLVRANGIPDSVRSELTALRPRRIVVAGGPASISDAVLDDLSAYVADGGTVERIGGIDRYDTADRLIRSVFSVGAGSATSSPKATSAFLATGSNFPDALAAGPAASALAGPVILIDGLRTDLDERTSVLLRQLGITDVYIAGGTAPVSSSLEASVAALLGGTSHVHRLAGMDRAETAVAINQAIFPESDYALVSSGTGFADALSGGPLAASLGAPLYLASQSCLSDSAFVDILDLDAKQVYLLGGHNSLSSALDELSVCP